MVIAPLNAKTIANFLLGALNNHIALEGFVVERPRSKNYLEESALIAHTYPAKYFKSSLK